MLVKRVLDLGSGGGIVCCYPRGAWALPAGHGLT
jgi:hypothetical protein